MNISHWLYPVQVLGPGNRIALWVQGCSRRCLGCVSPELQDGNGTLYNVNVLSQIINKFIISEHLTGITISGGEPFDQGTELLDLCSQLSTNDILVYTGYTYQELSSKYGDSLTTSNIGVIITNPYIEELNDNLPLRGSSNQEIIYLIPEVKKKYEEYLTTAKREQQLFVEPNTVYIAGIPLKGNANIIRKEINNILTEKGE